jgi:hypothetical protein
MHQVTRQPTFPPDLTFRFENPLQQIALLHHNESFITLGF